MLSAELKKRIKIYSVNDRNRRKADQRHADAAEVARGHAAGVQERNRALPHASLMVFEDQEELLPTE